MCWNADHYWLRCWVVQKYKHHFCLLDFWYSASVSWETLVIIHIVHYYLLGLSHACFWTLQKADHQKLTTAVITHILWMIILSALSASTVKSVDNSSSGTASTSLPSWRFWIFLVLGFKPSLLSFSFIGSSRKSKLLREKDLFLEKWWANPWQLGDIDDFLRALMRQHTRGFGFRKRPSEDH